MAVVDEGAERQLRALYEAHAGPLLAYACRLSDGDRGRAEEIVQETLLRAWRHREALERSGPVRPWLFTVARHLAVDAHRARRSRPTEAGDAALLAIPAAEELEATLDRIVLADALATLTPDHRAVLVEVYYRGRGVAETAALLGLPTGTVKSRTYYALRALKLALSERGVPQ